MKILYNIPMIFTDSAVVLYRQPFRESDRIVSLYTRSYGRLNARIPGVARSAGKLKALSEPLTLAELRFYVKRGGVLATVTGGKIHCVFPSLRTDLKRTQLALHCCELLLRLTPLHQVSPAKFELITTALQALEEGAPTPAFAAAFTLRLMTLAGFGLDHPVLQISPTFWARMHEEPFSHLVCEDPQDLVYLAKCNSVVHRFLERYLTYPLNTLKPWGLEHPVPVALAQPAAVQ